MFTEEDAKRILEGLRNESPEVADAIETLWNLAETKKDGEGNKIKNYRIFWVVGEADDGPAMGGMIHCNMEFLAYVDKKIHNFVAGLLIDAVLKKYL